jgi:hypothetical protein
MRSAGLVEGTRDGTTVRYRLAEPAIIAACDIVNGIVERRHGAGTRLVDAGAAGVTGGTSH